MPTHIAQFTKSKHHIVLFRADSGMLVAEAARHMDDPAATVVYGEIPNRRTSHTFIDFEHAEKWVLAYAQTDLNLHTEGQTADVQVIDVELRSGIIQPQGVAEFAGNSGMRKSN